MKHSWHRWIRLHEREAFEELGWVALDSLEGTTHGNWSVHMTWPHEGEPKEPPKASE